MRKSLGLLLVAFLGGILALAASKAFETKDNHLTARRNGDVAFQQASYSTGLPVNGPDFVEAASKTVHAVVHIKTGYRQKNNYYDFFFRNFYQDQNQNNYQASGSGVIISPDGYIVTNNHVVQDAETIEVTLNDKRSYKAEVIGLDPTTDIAVIKIKEDNLPTIAFGNSDNVRIGEWVLAVGNPFNLASTVTAGIISAKARNINILGAQGAIESFLQTDAVVNPGNSGGALVSTSGELIGINAAIASNTGSYTGYSFAIPSNLVKKVVDDLAKFGEVQRGYIGVTPADITSDFAKENNISEIRGVYVYGVSENSSAKSAGMEKGDIITSINDTKVNSVAELLEIIGQHRPGDKIDVAYERDGKELSSALVLKNREGTTDVVKKVARDVIGPLGADFKELNSDEKQWLGADCGLKVQNLRDGQLKAAGVNKGFIITMVDKQIIKNTNDLQKSLAGKKGGVMVEGIYPNRVRGWYMIMMKEE